MILWKAHLPPKICSFFWKNSKQDSKGTSPPPFKKDGKLSSDAVDKANILHNQFQLVQYPLKLSQLASMAMHDLFGSGTIDPSQIPDGCLSTIPQMESISVPTNGIVNVERFKPHKAAGPDQIKQLVLQKLQDVIASIIQVIFQTSLNTGSKAFVCPILKKETSLSSNYINQ